MHLCLAGAITYRFEYDGENDQEIVKAARQWRTYTKTCAQKVRRAEIRLDQSLHEEAKSSERARKRRKRQRSTSTSTSSTKSMSSTTTWSWNRLYF